MVIRTDTILDISKKKIMCALHYLLHSGTQDTGNNNVPYLYEHRVLTRSHSDASKNNMLHIAVKKVQQ
jgi:hypothetical protein